MNTMDQNNNEALAQQKHTTEEQDILPSEAVVDQPESNSTLVKVGVAVDWAAKEKRIVKICYIVSITSGVLVAFALLFFSNLNKGVSNNEELLLLALFFSIFGVCAFILFVYSILSIRAGRGYNLLGQFFVFLALPLLLGLGVCTLTIALSALI